jgi:nucleoside-diphosphate-sugar epimerase
MHVLVVGGSGAIGRELLPRLVGRAHEVVGTATSEPGLRAVEALGADGALLDATDRSAMEHVLASSRPDVVVVEVTSLSGELDRFAQLVERNTRVRTVATANAVDAAVAAGTRRVVVQSSGFWYAEGEGIATEDDPRSDSPAAASAWESEEHALAAPLEAVAARYGLFYGPGTWYAHDGAIARLLKDRDFPMTGRGDYSFVHVADAAEATALLVEHGAPGAYNVVDDDPAPQREWLPVLAEAVGAPRPPLGEPDGPVNRGASNAKLKAELGWQPRWPSWRMGFKNG